jgi:hypothetical protein
MSILMISISSLFSAENSKKVTFNSDQKIALGFTIGGGSAALIGLGMAGAGAGLMIYFYQNITVKSESYGFVTGYVWNGATDYTNAHQMYYYPGIALVASGASVAVLGIGLAAASSIFWVRGKKNKENTSLNFFFEPSVSPSIGLSIRF